jgi:hypothetical protein
MMLGYCISAWADVDELLFRIFRDCIGPYEQCAIIYYKTPGLEARFSLTDEIVKSVLPKKLPGEHDHPSVQAWNRTISGRDELLGTRRRIAHHPVAVRMRIHGSSMLGQMQVGVTPLGSMGTRFSWVELYMSEHEKLRGRKADLPPIKYEDLEKHYYGDVGDLANRLLSFVIDVLTKPDAVPSPPAPQPK